ncbi:MAG: GtrA family protein [Clostridia bacterium]|nr:GtrA family protein [Clostridia bacterium]
MIQCINSGRLIFMNNRKKELMRSVKFLLFSVSAGIIQIASFTLLEELTPAPHWLAYLVSLVLSVLWNFTFNRKFTFHSAGNIPVAMTKVALFYLVFTPLSTWWTDALTGAGVNEYLVLAGTMIVNFVTEFLYDRFFVFGKTIDTDGKAK